MFFFFFSHLVSLKTLKDAKVNYRAGGIIGTSPEAKPIQGNKNPNNGQHTNIMNLN